MAPISRRGSGLALAALVLVGLGLPGWVAGWQAPPTPAPTTAPSPNWSETVATVNGQPITRGELAEDLIYRKGRAQLDLLINRRIIEQACRQANIAVTEKEVEDELRSLINSSGCTTAAEFERRVVRPMMLMTLIEYKEDIIRQGLLTRKLAGSRIQVEEADLRQAFDSQFGEKVVCRIIIENNARNANEMHSKIGGDRLRFMQVARQQSDPRLAASAGQIDPISRYVAFDIVERRAFELKDGEVSEVLQAPEGGYVILLREGSIPARTDVSFESEREVLRRVVIERKAKQEVPKLMKELRQQAQVQDYLNNKFDLKTALERFEAR
ncbi:MAG TPA: peptidylprolyl isomerase [Gemmatales bacterium]|nr:peptidylprolyl isomerase [Gemmatales bacterium]HMP59278.1 peptidylprolyl isomerase [Gemmatales bacterium]